MLNCKYSGKVWKYLSHSELWIYFFIFSLSGFWIENFEIFPGSVIISLDLGYFQNILTFSTRHLKLWNFFTQVLIELNFEIFLEFFKPSWLELDFEKFLKNFQFCLIEVGLWNFFEIFSNLNWLSLNFEFFLEHVNTYDWTCIQLLNFVDID